MSQDRPSGPRRRLIALIVAPILAVIALTAWGFSSPVGSSPDDDFHLASIWCSSANGDCEQGAKDNSRKLHASVTDAPACYAYDAGQSAACQAEVLDSQRVVDSTRGNFDGGYPPVFYFVLGLFAGPDIAISVLLMRVFGAIFFIAVVLAAYLIVPVRVKAAMIWPSIVSIVPLGLFIVPSTNPSSWAILSAVVTWPLATGYLLAQGRHKIWLGVATLIAAVIGAGARADSAAFTILAIGLAALLTLGEYSFKDWRNYVVPGAALVVCVAFYFSAGQGADALGGMGSSDNSDSRSLLLNNIIQLPNLWAGVFGVWGLGWLDTPMPAVVTVTGLAAFAAVVFHGLRSGGRRKSVSLLVVLVGLIGLPLYLLYKSGYAVGAAVQPRYLLPLLIILVGVALWPPRTTDATRLRLSTGQIASLIVGISIANAVALHTNLRRYVTGLDAGGINLDHGAEWWWVNLPLSPMAVWVIGSVAFAAAAALVLVGSNKQLRVAEDVLL